MKLPKAMQLTAELKTTMEAYMNRAEILSKSLVPNPPSHSPRPTRPTGPLPQRPAINNNNNIDYNNMDNLNNNIKTNSAPSSPSLQPAMFEAPDHPNNPSQPDKLFLTDQIATRVNAISKFLTDEQIQSFRVPVTNARLENEKLVAKYNNPTIPHQVAESQLETMRRYYENLDVARIKQEQMIEEFERIHLAPPKPANETADASASNLLGNSALKLNLDLSVKFKKMGTMASRLSRTYFNDKDLVRIDEEWRKAVMNQEVEDPSSLIEGHLATVLSCPEHRLGREFQKFAAKIKQKCHTGLHSTEEKDELSAIKEDVAQWTSFCVDLVMNEFAPGLKDIFNSEVAVLTAIEYVIWTFLYIEIFVLYKHAFIEQDHEVSRKLKDLEGLSPELVGVRQEMSLDNGKGFSTAIEKMKRICHAKTTLNKSFCISEVCQEIVKSLEKEQEEQGWIKDEKAKTVICADDLISMLSYVIIQAKIPNMHSELMFMTDWFNENMKSGEEGYCFTTFCLTVQYVMSLTRFGQRATYT